MLKPATAARVENGGAEAEAHKKQWSSLPAFVCLLIIAMAAEIQTNIHFLDQTIVW